MAVAGLKVRYQTMIREGHGLSAKGWCGRGKSEHLIRREQAFGGPTPCIFIPGPIHPTQISSHFSTEALAITSPIPDRNFTKSPH